jgi:phosphoribosylformylglycinamidine synthase
VFHKWGLDAVEVGRVTDSGILRLVHERRVVAEIPAHALAEEGPRYERPIAAPVEKEKSLSGTPVKFVPDGADLTDNFRRLLAAPSIASKTWITEQYDSMVRTNTEFGPGAADAAVIRLKETKRALAIKTDGNGRWGFLDPRVGAMHAVVEAARNVACTGARPIAATNCLNFGNPEKPHVMWQFTQALDGIAEACTVLETPITGGNVSFYNETLGQPIYPTPILGVLGLIEDANCALGSAFRNDSDLIVLLDGGETPVATADQQREFSSSEYAKTIHGIVAGAPPTIDLAAEKRLIECLVKLAGEKFIYSAHDISEGGLAVTLAESCFASAYDEDGRLAANVQIDSANEPVESALFGERGARVIVSLSPASLARVASIAAQYNVRAEQIGVIARGEFRIEFKGVIVIQGPIDSFRKSWASALGEALKDP